MKTYCCGLKRQHLKITTSYWITITIRAQTHTSRSVKSNEWHTRVRTRHCKHSMITFFFFCFVPFFCLFFCRFFDFLITSANACSSFSTVFFTFWRNQIKQETKKNKKINMKHCNSNKLYRQTIYWCVISVEHSTQKQKTKWEERILRVEFNWRYGKIIIMIVSDDDDGSVVVVLFVWRKIWKNHLSGGHKMWIRF